MPVHLGERYTLSFACLAEVKSAGTLITTRWKVSQLSSPEFVRPREGAATTLFRCPTCRMDFSVRVESLAKARAKRLANLVVGAVLLALLLVWVPMLVHYGGQTVDEDQADSTVTTIGLLVLATAVSFVGGLTAFRMGRAYTGLNKLRRTTGEGRPSIRVKGHKFWP
ncbi:hypothetical protein [Kitasatospora sp. DSM 101779]|uniref:hypothetical protein n=1 Tax=Kitasatospora sp. DSM 101779 TaxID=2853165 RepID=UPI0021D8A34E|nr:hypothetical protein [Kitasatospora sp. DSM 101779]MCU7820916.1 hypothetical protein [Kitasatospora sp. DSM 101779]